MQPKVEKKDVQAKERNRWDLIQKTFKERQKKEMELIRANIDKERLMKSIRDQKREINNTRSTGKHLWEALQQDMPDSEFEDEEIEREFDKTRTVVSKNLKNLERPTLNSEQMRLEL